MPKTHTGGGVGIKCNESNHGAIHVEAFAFYKRKRLRSPLYAFPAFTGRRIPDVAAFPTHHTRYGGAVMSDIKAVQSKLVPLRNAPPSKFLRRKIRVAKSLRNGVCPKQHGAKRNAASIAVLDFGIRFFSRNFGSGKSAFLLVRFLWQGKENEH